MEPLKKAKIVTASAGVITAVLLGTVAYTTIAAQPTTPVDGESTGISVQLDKDVYDGVMGMLKHYKDYDKESNQFVQDGDKLYVVIEGTAYPVVETEDGLVVDRSGTETPEDLIGQFDADGNEIIGVTDDGLPIIGYDELGEAIIGKLATDEPISEALGIDNPQVFQAEDGTYYYHIVWGDTLCKISSELHYSVDELADYNHIRNVNLIYAESDLRIPSGEWTEAPND